MTGNTYVYKDNERDSMERDRDRDREVIDLNN